MTFGSRFYFRLGLNRNGMILLISIIALSPALCQSFQSDLQLIKEQDFDTKPPQPNAKLSLNPALLLLTFYQRVVSPQLSANCVFEVSCSKFSRQLIAEFGLAKGIALSADRLARCNRHTHRLAPKVRKVQTPMGTKIIDRPEFYSFRKFKQFKLDYGLGK